MSDVHQTALIQRLEPKSKYFTFEPNFKCLHSVCQSQVPNGAVLCLLLSKSDNMSNNEIDDTVVQCVVFDCV